MEYIRLVVVEVHEERAVGSEDEHGKTVAPRQWLRRISRWANGEPSRRLRVEKLPRPVDKEAVSHVHRECRALLRGAVYDGLPLGAVVGR